MRNESPRRIVAWTDGTAEALHAAGWAARHAVARGLPLHVVHQSVAPDLVGAGQPSAAGVGLTDRDAEAVDVVRLAQQIHRIRAEHHRLSVTVEVARDGLERPERTSLSPGDVLVTGPGGYQRLTARAEPEDRAPVPIVVVPERTAAPGAERHILLLTGSRLTPAVAAFAFDAAQDLGSALDVVRIAPQGGTFGDDYWIDPGRTGYLAESRLQADLSKLRSSFPAVPGVFCTLRTRPWATLRGMVRSAQLIVLDRPGAEQDPRRLLDLGACPVAVIPAR